MLYLIEKFNALETMPPKNQGEWSRWVHQELNKRKGAPAVTGAIVFKQLKMLRLSNKLMLNQRHTLLESFEF